MVRIASVEVYEDGQPIFKEGDFSDCIYLLKVGKVHLCKTIEGQREIVEILKPGDIFGEFGFIAKTPRNFSALAAGKATVNIIDRSFLDQEFNKLSIDFQKILMTLAVRLLRTTDKAFKSKLRRVDLRTPKKLVLKYKEKDTSIEAITENISPNGVFIRTANPLQPGDTISLDLSLPKVHQNLKVKCEVCWNRKKTKDPIHKPVGMGVKFMRISKKEHINLKALCAQQATVLLNKETVSTECGPILIEILSAEDFVKQTIFFAPGFSTTLDATRNFRKELASRGYRVISTEYPRNWLRPALAASTLNFKRLRPRVLKSIFNYFQHQNQESTILIGHSCGAIDITEAVHGAGFDFISTIILANPAGMTVGWENTTFLKKGMKLGTNFISYLSNFAREAVTYLPTDFKSAYNQLHWLSTGAIDFAQNPIEGVKDMMHIAEADISTKLLEIKKSGIHTILYINKDQVFPINEIMRNANKKLIPFAVYSDKSYNHHSIVLNYKESVDYIEDLIQFQEVVSALTENFPETNVIESMLNTKIFDLEVIQLG